MTKAFGVEVVLHGPITVRPPLFSTNAPTYSTLPPSTLFGALHYAYATFTGDFREVIDVGGKRCSPVYDWVNRGVVLDAVAVFPRKPAITNTMFRLINWRRSMERDTRTFAYQGVLFADRLFIVYSVSDEYYNELRKVAWGIVRLGATGGLVSVERVFDASPLGSNVAEVTGYFPLDGTHPPVRASRYDEVYYFPNPWGETTYCRASKGDMWVKYGVVWGSALVEVVDDRYRIVSLGLSDNYNVVLRWS